MKIYKNGFTLVELLIVISILGILSTIGFFSYIEYISTSRDTNKISQITEVMKGLESLKVKGKIPLPEFNINILNSGKLVSNQGYAGDSTMKQIHFFADGIKQKDFIYYTTKNKKYFQLVVFLEKPYLRATESLINGKIPYIKGDKLGILISKDNIPLQELTGSLDLSNIGDLNLKSYLNNKEYIEGSGNVLETELVKLEEINIDGGKLWTVSGSTFIKY